MTSGGLVQFPLQDEYTKDTGITPEDVKELREWIETQPHLPGKYVTDLELILALHCSDRDLEVTKKLIDTHYTLKTSLTMFFKDRVIDAKIENVLNIMLLQPLPTRTKEGYAIFYTKLFDLDPQKFFHVDSIRALAMRWDIWQYEEGTWPGLVMVSDASGLSFSHFYRMSLSAQRHFAHFFQEAFLAKLKQIHILNAPGYFDKMLAMIKPFLKKAIIDMIHIHREGSTEYLQYIPVEALPLEAGGGWKSVEELKEEALVKFRASADFFKQESKKRVDEEKRPRAQSSGFFGGFF